MLLYLLYPGSMNLQGYKASEENFQALLALQASKGEDKNTKDLFYQNSV